MKTEIIKRTFEAEKHPKGSPERAKLNENQITSEYMHGTKYIAFIHLDENEHNGSVTHNRGFATKTECQQWIDDNLKRFVKNHNMSLQEYIANNL